MIPKLSGNVVKAFNGIICIFYYVTHLVGFLELNASKTHQ